MRTGFEPVLSRVTGGYPRPDWTNAPYVLGGIRTPVLAFGRQDPVHLASTLNSDPAEREREPGFSPAHRDVSRTKKPAISKRRSVQTHQAKVDPGRLELPCCGS